MAKVKKFSVRVVRVGTEQTVEVEASNPKEAIVKGIELAKGKETWSAPAKPEFRVVDTPKEIVAKAGK